MKVVVIVEDHEDVVLLVRLTLDRYRGVELRAPALRDVLDPAVWAAADAAIIDLGLGSDVVNGQRVLTYLAEHHPAVMRIVFTAHLEMAGAAIPLADAMLPKGSYERLPAILGLVPKEM